MKLLGTLLVGAALVAGATGAAASTNITGTITSIDSDKRQIVLDGGKSFAVASNVTLVGLRPGDKVTVGTELKDGITVVSKIEETGPTATPAPPALSGQTQQK